MSKVRRLVLDVLMPHQPTMLLLADVDFQAVAEVIQESGPAGYADPLAPRRRR